MIRESYPSPSHGQHSHRLPSVDENEVAFHSLIHPSAPVQPMATEAMTAERVADGSITTEPIAAETVTVDAPPHTKVVSLKTIPPRSKRSSTSVGRNGKLLLTLVFSILFVGGLAYSLTSINWSFRQKSSRIPSYGTDTKQDDVSRVRMDAIDMDSTSALRGYMMSENYESPIRQSYDQSCSKYDDCCYHHPSENMTAAAEACSKLHQTLNKAFARAVQRNAGYGGGVIRIDSSKGGVLWQSAAGDTSYGSGKPMKLETPFELASVTKIITTATVLRLAEMKMISMKSKVVDILGHDFPLGLTSDGVDFRSNLTVWHCLSHRGGLPNFWDNANFLNAFLADESRFWDPKTTVQFASAMNAPFEPQDNILGKFSYGDTGFVLVGMMIEKITKRPLEDALREYVFDPLDMKKTYLSYREPSRFNKTTNPESHRYESTLDLFSTTRQSADWGSGGLVSDLSELSTFILRFFEGKIVSSRAIKEVVQQFGPTDGFFHGAKFIDYSLGVMKINYQRPYSLQGHDGHGNVFAYYWTKYNLSVVGTFNQLYNDWISEVVPMLKLIDKFYYRLLD